MAIVLPSGKKRHFGHEEVLHVARGEMPKVEMRSRLSDIDHFNEVWKNVDQERTAKIWLRLCANGALDDLGLEIIEGRFDLRGIVSPPRPVAPGRVPSKEFTTDATLAGVTWKNLDFSNARIGSITIRDSVIENCRFDGAWCRHLCM
jgi:hypothetical protein